MNLKASSSIRKSYINWMHIPEQLYYNWMHLPKQLY